MRYIYIAGAISDPNPARLLYNLGTGIRCAVRLLKRGFVPFCPFIDFQFFICDERQEITVDMIQNYSLKWLEKCDLLLVLPNSENSLGTKAEIERAYELDIPVIYEEQDLNLYQQ